MALAISTEPELLTRDDTESGQWSVGSCDAKRGLPKTNVSTRDMVVPMHDTPKARAIRAHEMMHAKLSPQNNLMDKWIERGIASAPAMVAVEELRVNILCKKLGFDMDAIGDDGDMADGERLVALKDWPALVMTAISYAETGSLKKFLNGVRRHDRYWGKILGDIAKRAVKQMASFNHNELTSTAPIPHSELTPFGFTFTEQIAEWVDRIASMPAPEEKKPEGEGEGSGSGSGDASADSKEGVATHSNKGITPHQTPEQYEAKIKHVKPTTYGSYVTSLPQWTELRIGKTNLDVTVHGSLGKKKIASNAGKNPRRMHRILTDPHQRIFDRKVRGKGGIVIIDASGSMHLSKDEVRAMMESAPGCTIVAYSDLGDGKDNAWILGKDGKIASEFPRMNHGNGVDFPMIEWAVKNRKKSSEAIIWVTDGGVCGKNDHFHDVLAMQCIKFCKANKITVVPNQETAIASLKMMQAGRKPETIWPAMFKQTWRKLMGSSLRK